jgi:hypothetical protein
VPQGPGKRETKEAVSSLEERGAMGYRQEHSLDKYDVRDAEEASGHHMNKV